MIQEELKSIVESVMQADGVEGTYIYNNWAEGNISADKITKAHATPLVMSVLPASGSFGYSLYGKREVQGVMLVFVDRVRVAPSTELMEPVMERMRTLALHVLDAIALSDKIGFNAADGEEVEIRWRTVLPSKFDAGLTGITLDFDVVEKSYTAYGCR